MTLVSQLLGSSDDLNAVADGARTISAPEASDAVALVQQALVAIEASLPACGIDGIFGDETGQAVSEYKTSRDLQPTDPVVGVDTTINLDVETAYLEGEPTDQAIGDTRILASDPLFAGTLEVASPGVEQRVIDFFQLGDRFCFRLSFILGPDFAKLLGRFVEGPIFADYCALLPPCTSADFIDASASSTPYVTFLQTQHPFIPADQIQALAGRRRPDILSNRPGTQEWYEIKPASVAGAIAAWKKLNSIFDDYARLGLPYQPGSAYEPTSEIELIKLITPEGENLAVILHVWRRAPGLIFYELCVKGDYVTYFNRVRLIAGVLAILAAIPGLLPAAEEAAGIGATVAGLAAQFGVQLPTLQMSP